MVKNNSEEKKIKNETNNKEIIFKENKFKKLGLTYGLLIMTVILFIIFAILEPRFISRTNIFNILSQSSIIGILGIGLTIILISGNFDYSFAANATIISVICPILITQFKIPLLIAYLLVILIAIGFSVTNGIFVVKMGMPSFITTLGMSSILIGLTEWITGGRVLVFPNITPSYGVLGKYKIGGIFPLISVLFIAIVFLMTIFVEGTYKGRNLYAGGFNLQAAIRSGINVKKAQFEAFIIMGFIAGIGGIGIGSLYETGNPAIGESYLFSVIIVTLLGAVFLKEGIPNILGTLIAALLMTIISNGLVLLDYPLAIREVAQGLVLILSVSIVSILKPEGIPPVVI
jgi:ribose transport system permease protein